MHRLFFYLFILLIPTQFGLHFWPDWAMVLGRRVDYLSPTLYLTDICILCILIFWRKRILSFPIFSIVFFATCNIFFSSNKYVAVYHWMKLIEFGFLGYYVIQTKPNISRISYVLSLSVIYSSIIAIIQFYLQHSIGGLMWFFGERTLSLDTPGIARIAITGKEMLRAYGTFPHPNVLAGFLAVTLPLILSQAMKQKKIFQITSIILGIIALVLTFSRSGIIVACLGLGWILFGKKRIHLFILVMVIAFSAIFLFRPQEESVVVRGQLNTAAIRIVKPFPLFGVGLGNFLVALPDHLPSRTIYFLQPVHNIYLLLWSEIGFVGLIGLIWIIRKWVKFNLALVAILLLGLADHYFLTLQQGRLLLTLIVALSYRELHSPENPRVC